MTLYGDFRPTGDLAFAYDSAVHWHRITGVSQTVFEYKPGNGAHTYWFVPTEIFVKFGNRFRPVLQVPLPLESCLT